MILGAAESPLFKLHGSGIHLSQLSILHELLSPKVGHFKVSIDSVLGDRYVDTHTVTLLLLIMPAAADC